MGKKSRQHKGFSDMYSLPCLKDGPIPKLCAGSLLCQYHLCVLRDVLAHTIWTVLYSISLSILSGTRHCMCLVGENRLRGYSPKDEPDHRLPENLDG